VFAEVGREVGGGALLFNKVVHTIDACWVSGTSRLSRKDQKNASLAVDEGLRVAVSTLDRQHGGRGGRILTTRSRG
jgi:hypothetical protein